MEIIFAGLILVLGTVVGIIGGTIAALMAKIERPFTRPIRRFIVVTQIGFATISYPILFVLVAGLAVQRTDFAVALTAIYIFVTVNFILWSWTTTIVYTIVMVLRRLLTPSAPALPTPPPPVATNQAQIIDWEVEER